LLVIRGGTSSFGQAALKMAVNAGVRVIATTRDRNSFSIVEKLGAERCGNRAVRFVEAHRRREADRSRARLGGQQRLARLPRHAAAGAVPAWRAFSVLAPVSDFNPLLQMSSGVHFSFFGSFVFGTPGFPLSDVPFQQIAADAAAGRLDVKPTRIFRFEEIREAHRVMEANEARGKMVVVHS